MAGDWIKVEKSLPDKPEVHGIAGMLDMDPDLVAMKLFRVWCWFDEHTENGNAFGVTYSLVDRITGVTGFGEAMNFVGWLEQSGKELVLPNFNRHNGETAKKRALTAKRVANHRNAKRNDTSVTPALPREEKRRERNTTASGQYSPEFEAAWKAYPKRRGDNPKARAFKAWNARLREGHSPEEITAGIRRYSRWLSAEGKEGTEYVKQAATFLGPDKGFLEPWKSEGGDYITGAI